MEALITQLITGAIGGNLAGLLMKARSLGTLWNTVAGLVGGVGGGQLLDMMGLLQNAGMAGDIGGSAVGGGIVMALIGMLRGASKE